MSKNLMGLLTSKHHFISKVIPLKAIAKAVAIGVGTISLVMSSLSQASEYTMPEPLVELPCQLDNGQSLPENMSFSPYCMFIDGMAPVVGFDSLVFEEVKALYEQRQSRPEGAEDIKPPEPKFGLVNTQGEVVVPLEYDRIVPELAVIDNKEQILYEASKDGRAGILSSQGDVLVPFDYIEARVSFKGMIEVVVTYPSSMNSPTDSDKISLSQNELRGLNEAQIDDYRFLRGLYSLKGEQIAPAIYEDIIIFDDLNSVSRFKSSNYNNFVQGANRLIGAKKDGKWGLFNTDGEMIYPFVLAYDGIDLSTMPNDLLEVGIDGKRGVVDRDNQVVIPIAYDKIENFLTGQDVDIGDELFKVEIDDNVGVINRNNDILIPLEYHSITLRRDGLIGATKIVNNTSQTTNNEPKLGLITLNNEVIYPFELDEFWYEIDNSHLRIVKKDGKYGIATFIDQQYEQVVPFLYDKLSLSGVKYDGRDNMSNPDANPLDAFDGPLADMSFDNEHNRQHPDFESFKDERYFVTEIAGRQGLLNFLGEEVLPAQFAKIEYIENMNYPLIATAQTTENDYQYKWRIYNLATGNPVSELFDYIDYGALGYKLNSGLIPVRQGDKYGYLNANAQVALDFDYQQAHPFTQGLAVVQKNDEWLVINAVGETVYHLGDYDYVSEFVGYYFSPNEVLNEGVMRVKRADKNGMINTQGEVIIPLEYKNVWKRRDVVFLDLFVATDENEREYVYDNKGKQYSYEEVKQLVLDDYYRMQDAPKDY